MRKKKYPFYMKWEGNWLKCACLFFSPCCDGWKKGICEAEKVEYDPCQGIEECMSERSYKRVKGALRQK